MAAHVAAKPPIDPTVTKTLDRIKRALADEATDPDSLRADLKKLDALDTKHWEDAPTREAILALRRQVVDGIEPARARKTERMRADLAAAKDNLRASQPKPGSFEAAVGAPMPHIFPAEGATAAEKPKPLSHAQAKLADLSKQYHKHIPLGDVLDAAKASGLDPVQEDGTPWSGFLTGADGRATIALVDRKTGKPSKRALSVQWHRMPSGNHELNAYIS
jgi:hypothetical protein